MVRLPMLISEHVLFYTLTLSYLQRIEGLYQGNLCKISDFRRTRSIFEKKHIFKTKFTHPIYY